MGVLCVLAIEQPRGRDGHIRLFESFRYLLLSLHVFIVATLPVSPVCRDFFIIERSICRTNSCIHIIFNDIFDRPSLIRSRAQSYPELFLLGYPRQQNLGRDGGSGMLPVP